MHTNYQIINEKTNNFFWSAGFSDLPAINATVFSIYFLVRWTPVQLGGKRSCGIRDEKVAQRVFHVGYNHPKNVHIHYPETLLFRWIELRIVIWHFFLEIWAEVKCRRPCERWLNLSFFTLAPISQKMWQKLSWVSSL